MSTVYLDHNASCPLSGVARQAMQPWLERPANASSRHASGRAARQAIDQAREQVAASVGAHPSQVIFTAGGTEADNLAIIGIARGLGPGVLAISAVEHPAVKRPAMALRREGWRIETLAVDAQGRIAEADFEVAMRSGVTLASVMLANNETGVMQNMALLARIARRHGVVMHTDAVQALGKAPLDFNALGVQAMSLSGHKIGGPQGVGALVVDKRLDLQPLMHGGGQEKGLRSGSENVAAIVGFGAACEALPLPDSTPLRDRLEAGLIALGAEIFGAGAERLGNTSFFAVEGIDGETLVMALDREGYAVASGSACSSDSSDPSPVLLAMGVSPTLAQGAVRVSLGPGNDLPQIEGFLEAVHRQLSRMRQMSALVV